MLPFHVRVSKLEKQLDKVEEVVEVKRREANEQGGNEEEDEDEDDEGDLFDWRKKSQR